MLDTEPLDIVGIRREVDAHLADFLDGKARAAAEHRLPGEVVEALRGFLFSGGKRVRPVLCVIGWHAAGGAGDAGPVVRAAASLEMFHAFALVHDDVMDDSATRRGRPALHHDLAARYRARADAPRRGVHAAILIGDLALAWSDEILHTAGLTPAQFQAALPVIDAMRSEIMYGQYLDLTHTGHPTDDLDTALRIIEYKTAKYTVERPLHLGAALARPEAGILSTLTGYGLPVGEAFQLRDDLLGTFGDPHDTGKPVLDDLREAKHTVLVALALQRADPMQKQQLRALIGRRDLDRDGAERIRAVLEATGARDAVEHMISSRLAQAMHVLGAAALPPPVVHALQAIARSATARPS
jgi:geranylgeranyl diphosphate synthase type I